MNIRKELLDEMLQECKTPPDLFGEGGILKQLQLIEESRGTIAAFGKPV
jgi:hypothetical protein